MFAILGTIGITTGRVLVGLILCIASIAKIRNGQSRFLKAVLGYELVPRWIALFLSHWLPWVEMLTGTLLLIGLYSCVAAFTAFGLLSLFSGTIVVSLLNKRGNDCGCFGQPTPIQWRLVYRNVLLMGYWCLFMHLLEDRFLWIPGMA